MQISKRETPSGNMGGNENGEEERGRRENGKWNKKRD